MTSELFTKLNEMLKEGKLSQSEIAELLSEPIKESSSFNKVFVSLTDAALMLSLLGGLCYALGSVVHMRYAEAHGVPLHFLPEQTIQGTILVGGQHVFVFFLFLLGAVALFELLRSAYPKPLTFASSKVVNLYRDSKFLFGSLVCCIIVGLLYTLASNTPFWRHRFSEDRLISVQEITLKSTVIHESNKPLLYVSRNDKCILLKTAGKDNYLFVANDEVNILQITGKR